MSKFYSTLLREVEPPKFGTTLIDIVPIIRKELKMNKKLTVIVDGDEYDSIECENIHINFDGDTIQVDITTLPDNKELKPVDTPNDNGFDVDNTLTTFALAGDILNNFKKMSPFYDPKNIISDVIDISKYNTITIDIQTSLYNIQNMAAVDNALAELVQLEKTHILKGNKILMSGTVYYNYTDDDHFMLTRTAVLIDPTDIDYNVSLEENNVT